eukprot:8584672-Pyramimonas_sp.AAC.1
MSPCQLVLGQLRCAQAARAHDPDQFVQDSDAKEESIHNAVEHTRGMAHNNSTRLSTAQASARYIKIGTFSIALGTSFFGTFRGASRGEFPWHVARRVPLHVPWRVHWHVP